jgi:hypothetical protein
MGEYEIVWVVTFNDWLNEGWEHLSPGQVLGVFTTEKLAGEFIKRYIADHPGVDHGYKNLDSEPYDLDKLETS